MPNLIFLIGHMGAGKSTVGRLLAQKLDWRFYDSDQEIKRKTGADISLIFELEGEAGFRKREASAIKHLCTRKKAVIATGGGAVLLEENRVHMQNHGCIVYLAATVNVLWQRIHLDKARPLIQGNDGLGKLTTLYQEREPIYRALAHVILSTEKQNAQQTAQLIMTTVLRGH